MSTCRRAARRLSGIVAALFALTAYDAGAHGGVSMEEDSCVMQIGPYRAHFTGYQPAVRASQEFCEDIPVVADAIIALDFINAALRDMEIDFRVVRDVNGAGIDATYADLGSAADIEAATLFYADAARYPRGNLNVSLSFESPGDFIGVVTARDAKTNNDYTSVFPFAVGRSRWYAGWGWIAVALAAGLTLYFVSGRRRPARAPA